MKGWTITTDDLERMGIREYQYTKEELAPIVDEIVRAIEDDVLRILEENARRNGL